MTGLGARLGELAGSRGAEQAMLVWRRERRLSWAELERLTRQRAEGLAGLGSRCVIAVRAANDIEPVVSVLGCLRAGVTVLLTDPRGDVPAHALAAHGYCVHHEDGQRDGERAGCRADPGGGAAPAYLLLTGGSTGAPKIVARPGPVVYDPVTVPNPVLRAANWHDRQTQLVAMPIHHAAGFMGFIEGLLSGNTLMLCPEIIGHEFWTAAERCRIDWCLLTPTHMRLIDATSVRPPRLSRTLTVLHTAAECPADLKSRWIELLGPRNVFEMYSGTERTGSTLIRGDEWLARPGSVGRGVFTQVRILDDAFRPLPAGEVGEVFMRVPGRRSQAGPPSRAGGASGGSASRAGWASGGSPSRATPTGFVSLGDLGRLDEAGYLYLSGRTDDLMLVGGENVYPAEIEAVIRGHPAVTDVAVAAVPDELRGERPVAYVVAGREPVGEQAILRHCADRLTPNRVPKAIRFLSEIPRTATGKIVRRRHGDWQARYPPGGER
ncbi:AMP-binding protein [Nonomuraea sp. NPDC049709]|uniref:class I adenylate-forming enzyme family protein n=1 Tax=Nonomuraea sp. NPDC049709 TaxID=3154736 RepID=UPI00341DCF82